MYYLLHLELECGEHRSWTLQCENEGHCQATGSYTARAKKCFYKMSYVYTQIDTLFSRSRTASPISVPTVMMISSIYSRNRTENCYCTQNAFHYYHSFYFIGNPANRTSYFNLVFGILAALTSFWILKWKRPNNEQLTWGSCFYNPRNYRSSYVGFH